MENNIDRVENNDFLTQLRAGTISNDDMTIQGLSEMPVEEIKKAISGMTLEEQKNILEKCISILESNVIKDPRTLEKLKSELEAINRKLKEKQKKDTLETDVIAAGVVATVDDVTNESKEVSGEQDKKGLNQAEHDKIKTDVNMENEAAKAEQLKQLYYAAIVAYYDARLKTLREQEGLISEAKEYKLETKLELEMYKAREAYMATGNPDPYHKFRSEHAFIDRQAHEPFERILREKAQKYRKAENEISLLDKEAAELNEKLRNPELTDTQREEYNERLSEIDEKRNRLELKKSEYKDATDHLEEQKTRENENPLLQKMRREAASDEELKGYDYQRTKRANAQYNAFMAEKTERSNIKARIAESEEEVERLKKQLAEVPEEDFKARLEILSKLNNETNKLQANLDQKQLMDSGINMSEAEMKSETLQAHQKIKEDEKKLNKELKEVEQLSEEQDKKIGNAVVENPELANIKENSREVANVATLYAIANGEPVPQHDLVDKKADCVIPGLEGKVKHIDDTPEGTQNAKEYIKQDEKIRNANNRLKNVEKELTSL